ncbi:MAG: hypothetical protein NTY80_00630 [candidate division SR1 bacterium]|nr:hypothetical protein [candidate division SR1 bacterium]
MSRNVLMKVLGLLILAAGEFLSIYAEMIASKNGRNIHLMVKPALIVVLGGICLMLGYLLSYMYFKNIWIVTAISITAIFIIEPILAWIFFHELPTRGSIIGFFCGVIGMLATIFL